MICTKCGNTIADNSLFCTFCGQSTGVSAQQQSAPITQEIPQNAPVAQEIPQSAPVTQEIPQSVPVTQEIPQSVPVMQEIPQSVPVMQEIPQSAYSVPVTPTAEPRITQTAQNGAYNSPVMPISEQKQEKPEKYYTFGHIALCLAAVAVMAIVAGVFAGLYFSVI